VHPPSPTIRAVGRWLRPTGAFALLAALAGLALQLGGMVETGQRLLTVGLALGGCVLALAPFLIGKLSRNAKRAPNQDEQ